MAPGRAKKNSARLSTELDPIAIGVTTEKADEFVQLFLHAFGNKDIAIKLTAAMGVSHQLAGLQQEVHALRSELASRRRSTPSSSSRTSWCSTRAETLCASPG